MIRVSYVFVMYVCGMPVAISALCVWHVFDLRGQYVCGVVFTLKSASRRWAVAALPAAQAQAACSRTTRKSTRFRSDII